LTIGLGIIGLGPAGVAMLGAAFGHDQVAVRAVADTDIEWLGPAAGEPRRYGSLAELLADDQVEAVHIATPTPLHFDHVRQALRAGRHVIVEKPVTTTSRQADELVTQAGAAGRIVIVGHSEAFEPYVQAVRATVAAGAIGTPTMVVAEKFTDWMRRPRLPAEWDGAAGGGIVRRQGVHQVDVVRTVTGSDFAVRAATTRADEERGVPGTYTAWLDGADGLAAVITHDGVGRLSAAAARRAVADSDEASKQARRRALLRRVLAERAGVQLGQADRERLLVFGTAGEIVASARQVDVTSGGGRHAVDLTAFAEGRHAVLNELLGALAGTSKVTHDLAWGRESLRTCEDIERVAQATQPAAAAK
jgi:phthalate 4,5-cis-dihydrodiol dehydrogenase